MYIICKYENQEAKEKKKKLKHELQQKQESKSKQSTQLRYFIFKSVVMNGMWICWYFYPYTLQGNSCLINGYCFAPNETNPLDWCYQCLPEISTSTWTKRQGKLNKQSSTHF